MNAKIQELEHKSQGFEKEGRVWLFYGKCTESEVIICP